MVEEKEHKNGLAQFAPIANLTVTGAFLVFFYLMMSSQEQTTARVLDRTHEQMTGMQAAMWQQTSADRAMLREELRVLHADSQRHWEATMANHRSVVELVNMSRKNQDVTIELAKVVGALAEEMRRRQSKEGLQ